LRTTAIALLIVGALAHSAGAVTTRTWKLTSYKDFDEGEANGVLLSSLGEATSGFGSTRLEVGEAAVYSSAAAPDGTIYFGTGDQGAIYVYSHGKSKKLAKLDTVLIASLAVGSGGTVFAGTMPGGRIFAVSKDGKSKEVVKLDAEHVWAMAYDESKQTLYAATGPAGKLFAVDVKNLDRPTVGNRARVVYDTGEKHLLSLLRGDDGALYAGSADQAILYRIVDNGADKAPKIQALHDFEGEELRAIARHGATLYVAVNEFQKSSSTTTTTTTTPAPRGTKIVLPANPPAAPTPPMPRDRKGKGAVYRVDPDGRVEQLHALADGYFTALHVDSDGNLWAASGANGRVYLIRPDRTVLTALDFPERQVLALSFDGPDKVLGTGDAGALYVISANPSKDASYTTKVLDANWMSRWGNVRWSGRGALTVETRSGNTSHPDKTWTAWQAPSKPEKLPDGGSGRVASPEGRYLQVRVGFPSAKALLRDLTIYYQPQNQPPRVSEITVEDRKGNRTRPRSPIVKLHWKTDNPDDDEIVYRLFFREESEVNWKPLGGPEPLTRTDFDWNTESIPDGNYVVRVVASDERANPVDQALDSSLVSPPFLVDNRKPELSELQVAFPYASGRARDSFSPITELSYSVDGGEWQPFAPRDGVLDDPSEDFTVQLPKTLAPGAHSLAVRAVDAADNVGATQVTFRVK
jgi:hypothetical protein